MNVDNRTVENDNICTSRVKNDSQEREEEVITSILNNAVLMNRMTSH